jgi:uncharacterized delta-60 repeat protein
MASWNQNPSRYSHTRTSRSSREPENGRMTTSNLAGTVDWNMKHNLHVTTALCALHFFAAVAPLSATADQTTNTSFALDQPIHSIALQPDGKVLIGGEFTVADGVPRGHVARLNPDGTTDFTFMNALGGANGAVYSTALQSDGKLLIGGTFQFVNGIAQPGVARLNPNGSLDTNFKAATGSGPIGVQIALQSDHKILIETTVLNGTTTHDTLYRLNADGTTDTNWLVALDGAVTAMAQQTDGKIIIVGSFTPGIARLTTNGVVDPTFLSGMSGVVGLVNCVAIQPDGKVLIGGYFFFVNHVARTRLARLNSDGSVDSTFQNGMAGADGDPEAIVLQPDGKVLIGGYFNSVNNTPRSGIARLNSDGSLDTAFQNGMAGADAPAVLSLVLQLDGKVLVGGGFTSVNGVTRYRIARLNANGSVDPLFYNGGPPPPILSNARIQSNHFAFQLTGQSNQVVVIETSTNLMNWLSLATNTLGSSLLPFTDPTPAALRTRFYRARLR